MFRWQPRVVHVMEAYCRLSIATLMRDAPSQKQNSTRIRTSAPPQCGAGRPYSECPLLPHGHPDSPHRLTVPLLFRPRNQRASEPPCPWPVPHTRHSGKEVGRGGYGPDAVKGHQYVINLGSNRTGATQRPPCSGTRNADMVII
jgi:hypothetical protein